MNLIDFDSRFTDFLRAWLEENQDHYDDIAQVELLMPELYEQFADAPAAWLEGLSPRQYFEALGQPAQLTALMVDYLAQEVPLPDLLPQRLAQLGLAAEDALVDVLLNPAAPQEARMLCVHLLQDIGSSRLMPQYIAWQKDRDQEDELADYCLESLEMMGEMAVPAMLEALDEACDEGREALLSVLSRYPGHPEVYEGLIRLFDALPERQAILAAYLARLGDARALPLLIERAREEGLSYLDYIELRAAIEALGGEAPVREFEADPDYDALMGLN